MYLLKNWEQNNITTLSSKIKKNLINVIDESTQKRLPLNKAATEINLMNFESEK